MCRIGQCPELKASGITTYNRRHNNSPLYEPKPVATVSHWECFTPDLNRWVFLWADAGRVLMPVFSTGWNNWKDRYFSQNLSTEQTPVLSCNRVQNSHYTFWHPHFKKWFWSIYVFVCHTIKSNRSNLSIFQSKRRRRKDTM